MFDLRTVEDCDLIRKEAVRGRKAVLIGMGFIGSEIAASLRQLGVEVTAIEGSGAPLQRVNSEPTSVVSWKGYTAIRAPR